MRFVTLSRHAAERRIRRIQTRWFHQRGRLRTLLGAEENAIEDQNAVTIQEATGSALAATMSGRARFGYFTNTFLLRDESLQRGRTRAQALLQTLRDQGFACSLETVNATDAFIGSLPGHGFANLRRPLISSRNVAHLFPTSAPWTGPSRCPNPFFKPGSPALACVRTLGSTPFYLNLYQEDVGHTLVVGATGAGKSVLAGFLALNFLRYAHSRVHVFDLGRSHLVPCLAAGGVHFDFGSNTVSALQPLRHIDHETERMWALSWLESIYDLSDAMPDARGRRELNRVLDLLRHAPIDHRTLTALHLTLPLRLQDVLERYTVKGPYGRLLDGEKEETSDARMQVYEFGPVLELGPGVMVPLLTALFRRIERSLDGSPTLIIIEEAWAALLEIVVTGYMVWIGTRTRGNDLISQFAVKIALLAFVLGLLSTYHYWLPLITKGFGETAVYIGGHEVTRLSPTHLVNVGLSLFLGVLKAIGIGGDTVTFLAAIPAFIILLCFVALAAHLLITMIESYIVVTGGLFFIGFMAFRGTAPLGEGYLQYVFYVGIKLFFIILIASVAALLLVMIWSPCSNRMTICGWMLLSDCLMPIREGRAAEPLIDALNQEREIMEGMLQRGDTRYVEEITSVLTVPGEEYLYRVAWREQVRMGLDEYEEAYEGHFQLRFHAAEAEDVLYANPLGIYVTDYTWTRVGGQ